MRLFVSVLGSTPEVAVLTITRDQDGNDETVLDCQSLLVGWQQMTHNGNNTSHDDGDNTLHHEIGT